MMNRIRRWSRDVHRHVSYVFAGALILVTLTGFTMMRGRRGFLGWGGVELLFPLAFLFLC